MSINSADEFYTSMGVLTQEMMDGKSIDADQLMKMVYAMAPFPYPQLTELREKYTYNITPFSQAAMNGSTITRRVTPMTSHNTATNHSSGAGLSDDEFDDDEMIDNINCFAGFFPPQQPSPSNSRRISDDNKNDSSSDISKVSPGAYAAHSEAIPPRLSANPARITLDIDMLRKQYKRLKHRQTQAHIIISAASARNQNSRIVHGTNRLKAPSVIAPIESPMAVNHLFVGREMVNSGRNRKVVKAPTISASYFGSPADKLKNLHNIKSSATPVDLSSCSTNVESDFSRSLSTEGSVASNESTVSLALALDTNSESSDIVATTDIVPCDWDVSSDQKGDCVTTTGNDAPGQCSIVLENFNCSNKITPVSMDKEIEDKHITLTSSETDPNINQTRVEEQSSCKPTNPDIANVILPVSTVEEKNSQQKLHVTNHINHSVSTIQPQSSFKRVADSWCAVMNARRSSDVNLDVDKGDDVQEAKTFNPFPKQYMNYRKARNGLRLGLYSMENVTKVDPVTLKASVGPRGLRRTGRGVTPAYTDSIWQRYRRTRARNKMEACLLP